MKRNALFEKLFVADYFFTIAIRKRQEKGIIEDKKFVPAVTLPANRMKWSADPILVDAGGETYLFYEAVVGDKGHIEVARVLEDCTLDKTKIVVQGECHYSYPFVFKHRDAWYMIPESSADGQICLYKAHRFPEEWELCSVLLQEKAVDTTVFEQNGQMYLLTFCPDSGTERVTPHAYQLELSDDSGKLKRISWEDYDSLRVRGAGPVFEENGHCYRPAQISREQRYGDGVVFYQVEASDVYREFVVGELGPDDLEVPGYYVNGLHTYCRSQEFEAIDIRCGLVDYFKPLRKLMRVITGK